MHQVHLSLSDETFRSAESQAKAAGYDSTETFLTEVLAETIATPVFDQVSFFTPERLAAIDASAADIDAGGATYSVDQVKLMVAETRREWEKKSRD